MRLIGARTDGIGAAGGHDHGIGGGGNGRFAAIDERFAEGRIGELGSVNHGIGGCVDIAALQDGLHNRRRPCPSSLRPARERVVMYSFSVEG